MMSAIYSLIALEILRARRSMTYWLRVLGIDEQGSRWMNLYLIGYMIFWVAAVWGWGVDNVFAIGRQLTSASTLALGQVAALVYLVIGIVVIFSTLRSMPLKFTYPQIFMEASSAVNRAALTLVTFVRFQVLFIVISGVVACFAVMLLNVPRADTAFDVGVLGLVALLTCAVLISATMFWGWAASMWWHGLRRKPAKQPFLLKLFTCAMIGIGIGLHLYWGLMFVLALFAASITSSVWAVGALMLVLAFAVFLWVAHHTSMTDVVEQSAVFARISKLNPMYHADLITQIKRQMALAKRKWRISLRSIPLQRVPEIWRSSHAMLNHSPGLALKLLFIGMGYASFISLFLQDEFASQPQFWMILLMMLAYQRPRVLIEPFEQVIGNTWLRQFHAQNNLQLFAYSVLPYLVVMLFGAMLALALQGLSVVGVLASSVGIVMIFVLLALCQAVALVRLRGFITKRLGYEPALLLAAIPIFLVFLLSQSALMAVIMVAVINAWYARLLAASS